MQQKTTDEFVARQPTLPTAPRLEDHLLLVKRDDTGESPVTSIFAWGDFVPETRQVFGQKS